MYRSPFLDSFSPGSFHPTIRPERPPEPTLTLDEEDKLIAHYFSVEKIDRQLRHEALMHWVDSGLVEVLGFYAFLGYQEPEPGISMPEVRLAA